MAFSTSQLNKSVFIKSFFINYFSTKHRQQERHLLGVTPDEPYMKEWLSCTRMDEFVTSKVRSLWPDPAARSAGWNFGSVIFVLRIQNGSKFSASQFRIAQVKLQFLRRSIGESQGQSWQTLSVPSTAVKKYAVDESHGPNTLCQGSCLLLLVPPSGIGKPHCRQLQASKSVTSSGFRINTFFYE